MDSPDDIKDEKRFEKYDKELMAANADFKEGRLTLEEWCGIHKVISNKYLGSEWQDD